MNKKPDLAQRRAQLLARRSKLSSEQQQKFESQLKGVADKQVQSIPQRATFSPAPLSLNQQRLWFLHQWEPESHAYNIFEVTRLYAKLDVAALNRSFNQVIKRHEILRTTFALIDGHPMQIIVPDLTLFVPVIDLHSIPMPAREIEARRLSDEESKRPFDLTRGPLVRLTALWMGDEDQVLLLTIHHIISDGWSVSIFVEEVYKVYQAYLLGKTRPLPELPIQYADFAIWQRQQLAGEPLQRQLDYWKKNLAGAPSLLTFPIDRPRPPTQTFRGKSYLFRLDPDLSQEIKEVSQQAKTTLFMTALAVFSVLLARYSHQNRIVVGTPVGNRHYREIESLIGFFVNTLVLCCDLSGNPTFWELLEQVRQISLKAHEHRDFPFEMLVQELQRDRDPSHNPLFQVMLLLDGITRREMRQLEEEAREEVQTDSWEMVNDIALFDLLLGLEDKGNCFHCALTYSMDIFDPATIIRMAGHFQVLLSSLVKNPSERIFNHSFLTKEEYQQSVMQPRLQVNKKLAEQTLVHARFAAQAVQTPDVVAVMTQDAQITYGELDRRADCLAHYLRTQGVGPEVRVAVYLENPIYAVIGVLAVLKAGGGVHLFAAVADTQPLTEVLQDIKAPVLVTEQRFVASVSPQKLQIICVDENWQVHAEECVGDPKQNVTSANLACVVPGMKAADSPRLLTHQELLSVVDVQLSGVDLDSHSRIFLGSCQDINMFLSGVLVGLQVGATLCMCSTKDLQPGPDLVQFLKEKSISTAVLPPFWLNDIPRLEVPHVNQVILVGEVCPQYVLSRWLPNCRIYNAYEIPVAGFGAVIETNNSQTLRPAVGCVPAGTRAYLLDAWLQPVPIGVSGELCVDADVFARGFDESPRLTAKRFIPHPFTDEPGARLYKTGELVCRRADGLLEFVRRVETKLEIRGRHIEPGQIETVLGQHPDVHAVVVRLQDRVLVEQSETAVSEPQIVAYIVLKPNVSTVVNALRSFLRENLPAYLHPAVFVFLDTLPLLPDGQVNDVLFPMPGGAQTESENASQSLGQSDIKSETSQQREKLSARESELSAAKQALLMKRRGINVKRK